MSKMIRILSLAGLAGGLGSIANAFVFAFTHGSTTVNKMGSVLGLNEQEWSQIAAVLPILLGAGLFAYKFHMRDRMNRLALTGYWVAIIALAIRMMSEIPQFFINIREDYQSPLGLSSWFVFLVSLPLLTVGMLILGIGCYRSGIRGSALYTPLLISLLTIPTLVVGGLIPGLSDDSTISRYIFGTTTIPLGLAWSWLSILALLQTSDKRY